LCRLTMPTWLLFLVGLVILSLDLICIFNVQSQKVSRQWNQQADERHVSVMNELSQLDSNLNQITEYLPQTGFNTHIASLEHGMQVIGARFDSLVTKQDLHALAKQWQQPSHAPQTEPSSTVPELPFTLVTLDVMDEQPFLVVEHQHQIIPLNRNDQIAGWQLVDVEYENQRVTWLNPEGKKITMKLSETDFHAL
jgi:hypothetical protein